MRVFKFTSTLFSILGHPLWMPFIGCLYYFYGIPSYLDNQLIIAKLLAISIITIFLPIVFLFIAKNLKLISDYEISNVKERRLVLMFFILLVLIILNKIIDIYNYRTLFYFFSGILFSGVIALFLSMFRIKISLHTLGISGLTSFLIGLSVSFQENLTLSILSFIIVLGAVASSRLYVKAHNLTEIFLGILVGAVTQIYFFSYWV